MFGTFSLALSRRWREAGPHTSRRWRPWEHVVFALVSREIWVMLLTVLGLVGGAPGELRNLVCLSALACSAKTLLCGSNWTGYDSCSRLLGHHKQP